MAAWRPHAIFCDAFDTLTSLTSRYLSSTNPSELHNRSQFRYRVRGKGIRTHDHNIGCGASLPHPGDCQRRGWTLDACLVNGCCTVQAPRYVNLIRFSSAFIDYSCASFPGPGR
jgi:hypothetical protein